MLSGTPCSAQLSMCRQTRGRTPVQPGDARVRSHERSAAQPERWLRPGYRLDAPAGIADGFGHAWAFQCVALAPRFSGSLLGWREMFKVLAGAIGLIGVVGLDPSSAFRAPHHFSTVPKRLLDEDFR